MYGNRKIITRIPLYLTITQKYFTFNEHCYLERGCDSQDIGCGSYHPALGGNVTNCTLSSCILYAMKTLAQNLQGIQIPNSGHWGPEERPDFVMKMLDNFFAGNSTPPELSH
jgi:hypothetical protein